MATDKVEGDFIFCKILSHDGTILEVGQNKHSLSILQIPPVNLRPLLELIGNFLQAILAGLKIQIVPTELVHVIDINNGEASIVPVRIKLDGETQMVERIVFA